MSFFSSMAQATRQVHFWDELSTLCTPPYVVFCRNKLIVVDTATRHGNEYRAIKKQGGSMRLKKLFILCVIAILPATHVLAGTVDIEQADKAQIQLIQEALGEEYPISKAAAVKSFNHGKAYYVGAVFYAQGAGDLTGVWFLNGGKSKPNSVYAVDENAYQFSGIKKACETPANASKADPEARAVKKYLEQ